MKRDISKDALDDLAIVMFNDDRYYPIVKNCNDFTKVMQFAHGMFVFTYEQLTMLKLEFDHYKKAGARKDG